MKLTMFERLQQLPLLMGMSTKDLENLVFKVQLDFRQHLAGDQIVMQNESCRNIIFVLSGTLSMQYRDTNEDIVVTEETEAPFAIEPFSMFGMKQNYTRDYTFETDGSTLFIPKAVFMNTLMDYPIIKTNMLNLVCNKMQQATTQLMMAEPATVEKKVIDFLCHHCVSLKGYKHFKIKMDTLADMIGETRINVSGVLKTLSKEGIIRQQRNGFSIPDMQKLVNISF